MFLWYQQHYYSDEGDKRHKLVVSVNKVIVGFEFYFATYRNVVLENISSPPPICK